ncbi:MAG: endonuclease domain-containing protein [Prevotella sp.]|nr:endonuclease domain-containing protein [Prevotella sp.]
MEYKTASPDRYGLLKAFARENRQNMTVAERILWDELRNEAIEGHNFLRQYIIGDYIVDFLCRDNGLIIEVDGGYHSEPKQQENDEDRTEWLESHGYHVLRFSNEEIMYDLDNVIEKIEKSLK